jgi:hypothetical protein
MANGVQTPRSRGTLCGLALILLGGWGGIAPFVGPLLRFGFTPDQAWHYTPGRLYLSAVPGAVVLLTGLIVAGTRSRGFGGFCAFIAALGGVWFIAGAALVMLLPAGLGDSITPGQPLRVGASLDILTFLAFFAGTGALIVFFASLALGRFSIAAYRDYADAGDDLDMAAASTASYSPYHGGQLGSAQPYMSGQPQYPSAPDQYTGTEQYSPSDQYAATGEYPAPAGQYPVHDPFGLTQDVSPQSPYPRSQSPFPPAPYPGVGDQPATPETTTAPQPPSQDQT